MRVIGYVRVSTQEQADGGVSLAAQEAKVRAYAALHDLELVDVIIDAGQSAKTLNRPGLQRALAMLKGRKADGVVVAKLDRLSRNVGDWNDLIDGYFGEKAGKSLMSVADSIDTRTAAGRLVLNVLMSVAQWEREAIGERTRDALAHKKAKGERTGQVPFGYILADDGVTLNPEPAEQEAIAIARRLRAEGLTIRKIVGEMNSRGVATKEGARWHIATVQRALKAA
jgi:DNA invertase Pin-like site-specific DNA recombinase